MSRSHPVPTMNSLGIVARLAVLVAAVAVVGGAWRLVVSVLGDPAGLATLALVVVAVVVLSVAGSWSRRLTTPYW